MGCPQIPLLIGVTGKFLWGKELGGDISCLIALLKICAVFFDDMNGRMGLQSLRPKRTGVDFQPGLWHERGRVAIGNPV
jgi:hypothetical protein